jgi:biotin carboxyl carrier protein
MRRYTIEIDGRRFEVDVEEAGEGRYGVAIGERRFEVTLAGQQELGQAQITPQMRAAAALAATPVAPAAAAGAPARSLTRPPSPPSPKSSVPPAVATAGAGGDTLAAPMPGLILRVAVAVGAQVRRGQDIAVLEAMKMENVLRAPRDGVVAEVCVEAGQQVGHGAPIVRFAPAAAG